LISRSLITHLFRSLSLFFYQICSEEAKRQVEGNDKQRLDDLSKFKYGWKKRRFELAELADLSVAGFREDLFRKEIFVAGIPKINQNQLSPEIFDGAHEGAFSWQKTSGFL
jgi:hypothetical protein